MAEVALKRGQRLSVSRRQPFLPWCCSAFSELAMDSASLTPDQLRARFLVPFVPLAANRAARPRNAAVALYIPGARPQAPGLAFLTRLRSPVLQLRAGNVICAAPAALKLTHPPHPRFSAEQGQDQDRLCRRRGPPAVEDRPPGHHPDRPSRSSGCRGAVRSPQRPCPPLFLHALRGGRSGPA